MKLKLFEVVTDKDKIDIDAIKIMMDNKDSIRDYAYICHDKDETRPHYHIAVRMKDTCDTKNVAIWFNIGENFIGKVKGRWSDMLKYLIHENVPEKNQYLEENVISNFDWTKEKNKINGDKRKEEIVNSIVDGTIRAYNYFDVITPMENDKYKMSIRSAFDYRTDKIKGVSRKMDVIFITGKSGVGKSTYAKQIAETKNYSIFVSSGSNDILDDYKGQDCIILDDLRASALGLADLLKMLDNHTASTVKSRYKNKVLECKLMIITTTQNIDTFFKNVFADEIETSTQLKRRCETHIRMESDYIYSKMWQRLSECYSKEFKMPNVVAMKFENKDKTEAEIMSKLSELLGGLKVIVDDIKDNPGEYEQLKISNDYNPFNKK